MTVPGRDWNEENLVEILVAERLEKLGWTCHPVPGKTEAEALENTNRGT
ncbi:MAG: hypothetical protein IT186_05250 [Acidobacteria bacterium]|nr:hypothetical protein [Acidobacteriota bacterium]